MSLKQLFPKQIPPLRKIPTLLFENVFSATQPVATVPKKPIFQTYQRDKRYITKTPAESPLAPYGPIFSQKEPTAMVPFKSITIGIIVIVGFLRLLMLGWDLFFAKNDITAFVVVAIVFLVRVWSDI